MALSRVSRLRPLLVLASFLTFWWLAPVAVRTFSRASFSLFEAPGWLAYSRLKDMQDYWGVREHDQDSLIAAGRDALRAANDADLKLQQAQPLLDENERLAQLLQLPPEPGFRYEVARVIRRDETAWWQNIIIRKGRLSGLAPGQGVVFGGGVVGRIREVDAYTAVVELSSSPSFRVAANLGADPNPAVYQGVETAPFRSPSGEVSDVQPSLTLTPGSPMPLLTSSLGGIFPQGLVIGVVERLQPSNDGLFQSGIIKLDPRLSSLHEVAVLVPDATLPLPVTPAPKPAASPRGGTTPPRRPGGGNR